MIICWKTQHIYLTKSLICFCGQKSRNMLFIWDLPNQRWNHPYKQVLKSIVFRRYPSQERERKICLFIWCTFLLSDFCSQIFLNERIVRKRHNLFLRMFEGGRSQFHQYFFLSCFFAYFTLPKKNLSQDYRKTAQHTFCIKNLLVKCWWT